MPFTFTQYKCGTQATQTDQSIKLDSDIAFHADLQYVSPASQ